MENGKGAIRLIITKWRTLFLTLFLSHQSLVKKEQHKKTTIGIIVACDVITSWIKSVIITDMEMNGDKLILASPTRVFAALNDLEVLRRSIPGCESLEKISDSEMRATVRVSIGPIKTIFNGQVTLSDIAPPHGYTISGKGEAVAGFAEGCAKVSLVQHPQGTNLHYAVEAKVGGKIAQLGGRLINSVAAKLAAQFFDSFASQLSEESKESEEVTDATDAVDTAGDRALQTASKPRAEKSAARWWWLGSAAVLLYLIWAAA